MQIYSSQKLFITTAYTKDTKNPEICVSNFVLFANFVVTIVSYFSVAALPRWVSMVKFVFSTVVLAQGAGPWRRAERRPKD
jgi:hypothetical protein